MDEDKKEQPRQEPRVEIRDRFGKVVLTLTQKNEIIWGQGVPGERVWKETLVYLFDLAFMQHFSIFQAMGELRLEIKELRDIIDERNKSKIILPH
jgi:hypothetical protein